MNRLIYTSLGVMIGMLLMKSVAQDDDSPTCLEQPIADKAVPIADPVIWDIAVPPSSEWRMISLRAEDGAYTVLSEEDCEPPAPTIEPLVWDFRDGPRPFLR